MECHQALRPLGKLEINPGAFLEAFVPLHLDGREVSEGVRTAIVGLDEADLGNALEYAISEEAAMKLPRAPEEQERLLSDLIKIMAADGELDEIEKRLFAVAAAKMNVQQTQLDQLITKLVDKQ